MKIKASKRFIEVVARARYFTDENTWFPLADKPMDWESLKDKRICAIDRNLGYKK